MINDLQYWGDAKSVRELLYAHSKSLQNLLSSLDLGAVEQIAEIIDDRSQQGNTIYCIGNGGSAATASHISADLSWGRRKDGGNRPNAISLVSNTPLLTALGNDSGYDNIFVEQMKNPFREGDVVVAISASGNSENVLRAVQFANEHDGYSVSMTGFDGGQLLAMSKTNVHVPTPNGMYELVEDVHHSVCHMLANCLKFMASKRAGQ